MNTPNRRRIVALAVLVSNGLLAQTTAQPVAPAATDSSGEDVIILSPFEVTADSSSGYVATQTLAGSRINTRLEDVGSAISVITAEFLRDTGATDNKTLLAYTTNTEVGGTQGNFRGSSGGQGEDESGRFTNPNGNTRVRGLTSADNTRNFFASDIPWDGYNVDRVDMQRGPNSILFGLGSPAGIINASTKTAHHRNTRDVEFRYGSYGSNRVSLDVNQNLLPDEFSIRINLLRNDEKYRQDPAYSLDRRVFGTLRYDPKFLNKGAHKTGIRVSYEKGEIDSNNPRTITPRDQITQWWGALNKKGFNPNTVQTSGWFYDANGAPYRRSDAGQFNRTWADAIPNNPATGKPWTVAEAGHELPGSGVANPGYSPWLGAPVMYGGIWLQANPGDIAPYSASMSEYKNIRGINSNGAIDGGIGGLPYSRRVSVASTSYWAERATAAEGAKYQSFGIWKAATLTDPSVFDFYNKLIDGENKQEWQNFENFNAALSQTFFDNKFGFDLAYDYQKMNRGQYSFDGAGVLYIDINTHNIDGSVNSHFGQPYIESNYLYGNNTFESERDAARMTAFFDHDFNKDRRGGWLRKLLGRHTVTGLLSQEKIESDQRNFNRYGTPDDFAPLVANKGSAWFVGSGDRTVAPTIYLAPSLKDASTSHGANIPNAGAELQIPSTVAWQWFDSTWNSSVNPAAPWTNTYNGQTSTQAENPANYVGRSTRDVKILSAAKGDQDLLTRTATLNKREVNTMAGSWQAYFWDGAVVGLYGLREDRVKTWALEGARDSVYDRVNFSTYTLEGATSKLYVGKTKSWSAVAKLTQLAGRWADWSPVNVSVFYNKSDNFQVTGARNDLYGVPLAPPSGDTKDMGVMLSTKDQKYYLKVNRYETTVLNAGNSMIDGNLWYLMGGDNFITRLESRADAYQYHLKTRDDFKSINFLDDADPRQGGGWGWYYTTRTGETEEHATLTRMAAVAAWRDLTTKAPIQKILQAWGYPDLNQNPMSQTAQANPTNLVANFRATEDQISKGWEFEFTANPTKNWRFTLNASETKASRSNVGGSALTEFVTYANSYHNKRFVRVSGPGEGVLSVTDGLYSNGTPGQAYYFREATAAEIAADAANIDSTGSGTVNTTFGGIGNIPMWSGGGARNGEMNSWNSNFYSKYLLLKLQEGTNSPELRRWRANFVTNYNFTEGRLKGVNLGAGYRWQDKIAIGYPVKEITGGSTAEITFDTENPYYGPTESAVDLWIGYERKVTAKINWRVQLNVRNVGKGNKLIPLSTQWDGSVAAWGIAPSQTWSLTNSFSF